MNDDVKYEKIHDSYDELYMKTMTNVRTVFNPNNDFFKRLFRIEILGNEDHMGSLMRRINAMIDLHLSEEFDFAVLKHIKNETAYILRKIYPEITKNLRMRKLYVFYVIIKIALQNSGVFITNEKFYKLFDIDKRRFYSTLLWVTRILYRKQYTVKQYDLNQYIYYYFSIFTSNLQIDETDRQKILKTILYYDSCLPNIIKSNYNSYAISLVSYVLHFKFNIPINRICNKYDSNKITYYVRKFKNYVTNIKHLSDVSV